MPIRVGGMSSTSGVLGSGTVERSQMQVEELRQFKSLCDRLLPGLRTQSHLYKLIHVCHRTHTITLSEFGEVIGGATFRLIQASASPCLILEVLLLAVEQRAGVCGRGYGTRIVNYLKRLALTVAQRRGLAAGLIAQVTAACPPVRACISTACVTTVAHNSRPLSYCHAVGLPTRPGRRRGAAVLGAPTAARDATGDAAHKGVARVGPR